MTDDTYLPVDPPIRARAIDTQTESSVTSVIRRPEVFLTEPLRAETCGQCGQRILRALADGLDYRCDPQIIDLRAELAAKLAGRYTCAIFTTPGRYEFIHRDTYRIKRHPDDVVVARHICPGRTWNAPHEIDAVVLHRCGAPLPAATSDPAQELTDEPPF